MSPSKATVTVEEKGSPQEEVLESRQGDLSSLFALATVKIALWAS